MTTLSVSIHDPNNLGDKVCNPCDYFDSLRVLPRLDAWGINWIYQPENMIFGGGGMVHGLLEYLLRNVKRTPERKLIAWGLGHNRDGGKVVDYGNVLDGFDLVGVRDFKASLERGWDYVPCASCLNAAFESKLPNPFGKFVVYQHFGNPIKLRGADFPTSTFSNDATRIDIVLGFLSAAETVITNSYHGAYWAMLLGRKVLLYKPFSSRFCDLKYQPPSVDEFSWKTTEGLAAPEGYLDECRTLNRAFFEKVKTTLGISDTVNT